MTGAGKTHTRYPTGIGANQFPHDLADVQIVFHGINKSGSLAMSNTIGEAYEWAGRKDEFISHYRLSGPDHDFRRRIDALNGKKSFVVGHYLYGALAPCPNRIYITQFRHPLPHVLSFYQWLKNKHVSEHGTTMGYPTLIDYVLKSKGVRHSQVAQFGAGFGMNRKFRIEKSSTMDLFHMSVDSIEADVYAIGISEYFEESIFLFSGLCGLQSVAPWIRDNRNKGRPLVGEITEEERSVIEEVFEYDFSLYEYALDRFQRQNSRFAFGDALQDYRAACADQYKDRILAGDGLPPA